MSISSTMVNIIFINHVSQISGAERVLLNLISLLDKSAVNPTVVCPENGKLVKELEGKGVSVRLIPIPVLVRTYGHVKFLNYLQHFLFFSKVLKKELKRLDIDIIHCNTFTAALYSILPARSTGTPVVWHMHDILQYRLFNKIFIRLACLGVNKIICVSNAVKKNLVCFGVNEKKCEVIYNSIPREVTNKKTTLGQFRKEIGVDNDTKIITMIGQIAEWKGQEVFIEAVLRLVKNYRDIKCIIVGDIISPLAQQYKEYIYNKVNSLNLSKLIIFTGFRDDVDKIMNDSDVIVHATIKPDPLPTVIIEAMNSGKPVVATNVGGVPELVVDNETGFIVPPKDADVLASAISKLLDNPDMREKMGLEGKRLVEMKFNPRDNLSTVLKLYNSLLPEEKKGELLA